MPTQKAIDFIVNLRYDRNLLKRMNEMRPEQVHPYLETIGYVFTLEQLEDAVNYYKLRCPSDQSEQETDEIRFWHRFLTTIYQKQTIL